MGRLGVLPSNIQRPSCILISCWDKNKTLARVDKVRKDVRYASVTPLVLSSMLPGGNTVREPLLFALKVYEQRVAFKNEFRF